MKFQGRGCKAGDEKEGAARCAPTEMFAVIEASLTVRPLAFSG
jgi:hypothetical protein